MARHSVSLDLHELGWKLMGKQTDVTRHLSLDKILIQLTQLLIEDSIEIFFFRSFLHTRDRDEGVLGPHQIALHEVHMGKWQVY